MDMDSKFLWAEAAATAVYVKNRLPHAAFSNDITPFEALNGHKPTIKHLQAFGRVCSVHMPEESRPPDSKLFGASRGPRPPADGFLYKALLSLQVWP